MLRKSALCLLAGVLGLTGLAFTAQAEDVFTQPDMPTDQYQILDVPAYPSWLLAEGGNLTKVNETEIGVMYDEYGPADVPFEASAATSSNPLARGSNPSLGQSDRPTEAATGDVDGDGSPEVVAFAGRSLAVTGGLDEKMPRRAVVSGPWADPENRPVGVGFYEDRLDATRSRPWIATVGGEISFYELNDGRFTGAVDTYDLGLAENQELLDASFRSRLDSDVHAPGASLSFGTVELLVHTKVGTPWTGSSLEARSVAYVPTRDDKFLVSGGVDVQSPGWKVGAGRIVSDYGHEGSFSDDVRKFVAAFVTKEDDATQGWLTGNVARGGGHAFCPSTDPAREPNLDLDVLDHGDDSTGATWVASCAADAGTSNGKRTLRVDMVYGPGDSDPVVSSHTYATAAATSGPMTNLHTQVDIPCTWLLVNPPADENGAPTSPSCSAGQQGTLFTSGGRREAIVNYQDAGGANRVEVVSRDAQKSGSEITPANTWSYGTELATTGDPFVIPLPPLRNKVKILLDDKDNPDSVVGRPRPVVVLASPPYVAGAGQSPLAGPTYNKRSESGGSEETNTENTFTTGIGVDIEDPTNLFGFHASVSLESAVGSSLETSRTVTRSEQFVGSPTEDTVVYDAPTFWKYEGTVVESSTGAGLGTRTAIFVPRSNVLTSAPLSSLQSQYPSMFGTGDSDRGALSRVLNHRPGNPGSYTEWGSTITLDDGTQASANVSQYCDGASFDETVPPIDERGGYPYGVDDNPFLIPELDTRSTGVGVLASDLHTTNLGDTSEGAGFSITNSTDHSRISSLTVDAEAGVKAAGIEATFGAGHTWGQSWTSSLASGVDFLAYVGHIPTEIQTDEKYDWRVFLCKKRMSSEAGGAPVWVLNYTVDNYNGSGGLEPLADIDLGAPTHSTVAPPTPGFAWSQESGTVRSFELELDAIGATDHRVVPGLKELTSTRAATSRAPDVEVQWADLEQSTELRKNQLYRWRVEATDFFGNTVQSEWDHFVTAGAATTATLEASNLTPTVNEQVTLTATHEGTATSYRFELGDGRVVTQAGRSLTTTYPATGVFPVQVTITNEYGSTTARTTLSVGPSANDEAYSMSEDGVLQKDAANGVMANDAGADTVALTAQAGHGTARLGLDGSFTYTPAADWCGTDRFGYAVRGGAATRYAEATVTVDCVNDLPVARPSSYAGAEDQRIVTGAPGVLAAATDADGDRIGAALVSGPTAGTLDLRPDGSFSYTPGVDYCGTDSFTWQPTDGTASGAPVTTTLKVGCVNDPPVGHASSHEGTEDEAIRADAPGVLTDASDVEGDPVSAEIVTEPASGSVELSADGSFSYTPDADFCGADTFTWRPTDGTDAGAEVMASLDVGCVNDAPTGKPAELDATEDDQLRVDAPGLLTGARDAEGDPITAEVVTPPAEGALELDGNGAFTYTPDADFCGTDTFGWRPSDGTATGEDVTVTLNVRCVNDAPVAEDDHYDAVSGEGLEVTAPGLLDNDSDPVEGHALSVLPETTRTAGGTLTTNADGGLLYRPRADFRGTDTGTYTLRDAQGGTASGTVTFTVKGATDVQAQPTRPVFNWAQLSYVATVTATLTGTATDEPIPGETLRFLVDGRPFCSAVTGATGTARCTAKLGLAAALNGRYTATFDESESWLASTSESVPLGSLTR